MGAGAHLWCVPPASPAPRLRCPAHHSCGVRAVRCPARSSLLCPSPALVYRAAGHLLAGSNFDDDQKKTTGGRNGYGAKLCNIFSTEFCVETADSEVGKQYKQYFRDNMSKTEKAKISDYKKKEDWTRISWIPDLSKFGMVTPPSPPRPSARLQRPCPPSADGGQHGRPWRRQRLPSQAVTSDQVRS